MVGDADGKNFLMRRELPVAVILGLSPTGLYAARELGDAGIPLLGISDEFNCGCLSRHFRAGNLWREPIGDKLLQRLLCLGSEAKVMPVLIPTSDRYIEFVFENHDRLSCYFRFQASYSMPLARQLLDKESFFALCVQSRVETPSVAIFTSGDQLRGAQIEFPALLKPAVIHKAKHLLAGWKLIVLESQDDIERCARLVDTSETHWLLQAMIPGPESNILLLAGYFNQQGELQGGMTYRKVRQYPPGFGSASCVVSEANAEIISIGTRFLQALNYQGLAGVEFKVDSRDGVCRIIEVNQRPTLWFNIVRASGVNLCLALYTDLTGVALDGLEVSGAAERVIWRYVLKDIYSNLTYHLGIKSVLPAPEFPRGARFDRTCWAVYAVDDPLPALAEPLRYAQKFFNSLRG